MYKPTVTHTRNSTETNTTIIVSVVESALLLVESVALPLAVVFAGRFVVVGI